MDFVDKAVFWVVALPTVALLAVMTYFAFVLHIILGIVAAWVSLFLIALLWARERVSIEDSTHSQPPHLRR